jgi:hypothetical protein
MILLFHLPFSSWTKSKDITALMVQAEKQMVKQRKSYTSSSAISKQKGKELYYFLY